MRLKPEILIPFAIAVAFSGCSMLRHETERQISEVSMSTLVPVIEQKIDKKLEETLPKAIDDAMRKTLGDLVYESMPWLIAALASGGGVAGIAKVLQAKKGKAGTNV